MKRPGDTRSASLVHIVNTWGDLYGLEAFTEPVVQKADQDDEPASVPDRLVYRDE